MSTAGGGEWEEDAEVEERREEGALSWSWVDASCEVRDDDDADSWMVDSGSAVAVVVVEGVVAAVRWRTRVQTIHHPRFVFCVRSRSAIRDLVAA